MLSGIYRYAIKKEHVPKGTTNPVTFAETASIPDFDGRAYSLEEIALMCAVLPEPSRTVMMTAAFTGLRVGELRGLTWGSYLPGDDSSLGVLRVLQSIWRGRVGTPKTKRSKAVVVLIPQVSALLEQHRIACGNPVSGPIFANGAGNALDLDSLYQRQMKEPFRKAGVEWEGWHGFRRGLANELGTHRSARVDCSDDPASCQRTRYQETLHQACSFGGSVGDAAAIRDILEAPNAQIAPHKCSPTL